MDLEHTYNRKYFFLKGEKKKIGKRNNSPSREEASGSRTLQGRHLRKVRWIVQSDREGGVTNEKNPKMWREKR
jgi:hypothetical protein